MKRAKIRFVGGPWDNELRECELHACYYVAIAPKLLAIWDTTDLMEAPSIRKESYYLCRFYTEYKTLFLQYVHESMMRGGEPARKTYTEDFPEMEFDPWPMLLLWRKLTAAS
jgi:hypothetical protein